MSRLVRCNLEMIMDLLLLTCHTAIAAPDFAACGSLPHAKIEVPDGQPILTLHANGTRNYTCSELGGATVVGDNQGEVLATFNYEGNTSIPAGSLYTAENGDVIYIIDFLSQNLFGRAEMDSSVGDPLGPSPIFQPSPRNDSIPWARWRVLASTGQGVLENVTYVTRFDTEGGGKPLKCPLGRRTVEVPFKAAYTFYTCTDANTSVISSAARCILQSAVVFTTVASLLLTCTLA